MALESDLAILRQRHSVKWSRFGPDVIPAWLAEMDLPLAPMIERSITAALRRHDLGYSDDDTASVPQAYRWWAEKHWNWQPEPALMTTFPTVMRAIAHALRRCSRPGDAVVVQTPIYPPFLAVVPDCERVLVEAPLSADFGIDFERLDAQVEASNATVLLICNPHNPTGRVFTGAEVEGLAELARRRDCVIVSDEVHADLVYQPHQHWPMAIVAPERTVTVTSAAKSFNIAGLRCALAVASTEELHRRLRDNSVIARDGIGILGLEATAAVWSAEGAAWLQGCREQLAQRRAEVVAQLGDLLAITPEATYLAWLDARSVTDDAHTHFLERAKVALSDGAAFGAPGRGFVRLNFATTESVLKEIVRRLRSATDRN